MWKVIFLVHSLFFAVNCFSQEIDVRIDSINHFNKECNVLFLKNEDALLIEKCLKIKEGDLFKNSAALHLIASYDRIGDTAKSATLLRTMINSEFDESRDGMARTRCVSMMAEMIDKESMHYFLNVPYNRKLVEQLILSNYEKESMTQKAEGVKLLKLIIHDQFIRANDMYALDSLERSSCKRSKTNAVVFRHEDSINCRKLYEIYERGQRLFSIKEVGSVYWFQFLLFAHEANVNRRTFYLKLLKKGLKQGNCDASDVISFILLSEAEQNEKYNEIQDRRIEELKKEFNAPEYYYRLY